MSCKRLIAMCGVVVTTIAIPMSSARANTILVFGQSGISNAFSATESGGSTSLSAIDIPITITYGEGLVTPLVGLFLPVGNEKHGGRDGWIRPHLSRLRWHVPDLLRHRPDGYQLPLRHL